MFAYERSDIRGGWGDFVWGSDDGAEVIRRADAEYRRMRTQYGADVGDVHVVDTDALASRRVVWANGSSLVDAGSHAAVDV